MQEQGPEKIEQQQDNLEERDLTPLDLVRVLEAYYRVRIRMVIPHWGIQINGGGVRVGMGGVRIRYEADVAAEVEQCLGEVEEADDGVR